MPPRDRAVHLLVIAKSPVPGAVKTRLSPPYSLEQAAELAAAALADTLAAVAATPAVARTIALAGPPLVDVPAGFALVAQRGDGLDERLAAAFDDAAALAPDVPILLVGMDTPQVTPVLLSLAAQRLLEPGTDAVLGLAVDGGWWALGLRRPDPRALLGVAMSTDHTGMLQHQRLQQRGLSMAMLDVLDDVDTADDAVRVAAQAPHTRFAEIVRTITPGLEAVAS